MTAKPKVGPTTKPKFAMYWAAACGGCDVSLLNIHARIREFAEVFDIVFWPCVMDGKKQDLEALADKSIALTFFNGAIRTSENEEMARLLRAKSQVLVAYGSCACEGCIPGLSNLFSKDEHFRTIFQENPSTDNPGGIVPMPHSVVPEGELSLPKFLERVKSLGQTVCVDSFLPGCPPEAAQVDKVVASLLDGVTPDQLPRVLGAGDRALCEECPMVREGTRISKIYRAYEKNPEPDICLLEQGLLCMGPATRSGCGAKCPQHLMGCLGCYGGLPGEEDQGAAMLAAIASKMENGTGRNLLTMQEEIRNQFAGMVDPAGQLYKFSLTVSLLGGKRQSETDLEGVL